MRGWGLGCLGILVCFVWGFLVGWFGACFVWGGLFGFLFGLGFFFWSLFNLVVVRVRVFEAKGKKKTNHHLLFSF